MQLISKVYALFHSDGSNQEGEGVHMTQVVSTLLGL